MWKDLTNASDYERAVENLISKGRVRDVLFKRYIEAKKSYNRAVAAHIAAVNRADEIDRSASK